MKKYTRHSFFNAMDFWTFATFRKKWGPKTNIWPDLFLEKWLCALNSIRVIFFEQIYTIVLPIRQVFLKKKIWWNVRFGTLFIAEGGKCSKIHCVEKTMPCVFFQKWLKKTSLSKKHKHHAERFWKTLDVMFSDFL